MPIDPEPDTRLAAWETELKEHVIEIIDSRVTRSFGTIVDPYSNGLRVGYPPLLVLFAGRCITEGYRSALNPAASVELARLHLQTHGSQLNQAQSMSNFQILSGDLYRALASRTLIEHEVPCSQRVQAIEVLSESLMQGLEDIVLKGPQTFDWILEDAAVRISTILFKLSGDQRQALRTYATQIRSDRETGCL
jgi:hypothetical protein